MPIRNSALRPYHIQQHALHYCSFSGWTQGSPDPTELPVIDYDWPCMTERGVEDRAWHPELSQSHAQFQSEPEKAGDTAFRESTPVSSRSMGALCLTQARLAQGAVPLPQSQWCQSPSAIFTTYHLHYTEHTIQVMCFYLPC